MGGSVDGRLAADRWAGRRIGGRTDGRVGELTGMGWAGGDRLTDRWTRACGLTDGWADGPVG